MDEVCRTKGCSNLAIGWDDDFLREYCYNCEDRLIERDRKRQEWNEFHPDTPCPEIELE